MGNNNGKESRKSCSSLPREDIRKITEALRSHFNKDVSNSIDAIVIQEFWMHELVPPLLQQYKQYLCPTEHFKCNIEQFGALFMKVVRGTPEEKVITLGAIIGYKKDVTTVPHNRVLKYVADLLESYLMGIEWRKTREFRSWDGRFANANSLRSVVVAGDWCRQLIKPNYEVSKDELEQWVLACGILATLHIEKLGTMYGLQPEDDDDRISLMPFLMNPEALGVTKTVLESSYIVHLNYLLPQECQREWRFLFSTNHDGESFSMLLGKILGKGPTILVVCDDKNHVFGGFASHSWSLSPKFQGNSNCFLFTLHPEVQVFYPTGYNDHYMYLNHHQQSMPNGLGMGGQFNYWGLWLDAQFGLGTCSDICTTYRNYKMLSASREFKIKSIEVWSVGPPPLTSEMKGERTGILDKDPTAASILEMAGKKQHSVGLREKPET